MFSYRKPTKPWLKFYGSKWDQAPGIIQWFPPVELADSFLDVFGGSGAVLLQMRRRPHEIYNDVDLSLVNLMKVARDEPEELRRRLDLTVWSRAEFQATDPVWHPVPAEWARRTLIRYWMSVRGSLHDGQSWRSQKTARSRWRPHADDLKHIQIEDVAARLRGVLVEHMDAAELIAKYDHDRALFYIDPPYLPDTRGNSSRSYDTDDLTFDVHARIARVVRGIDGFAVISHYDHPFYNEHYTEQGWARVTYSARTNSGGEREETLFLCPRTAEYHERVGSATHTPNLI